MSAVPPWLHMVAVLSLGASLLCAAGVLVDELAGRRQPMAVMNVVWPITMLWAGPLGLAAYLAFGRAQPGGRTPKGRPMSSAMVGHPMPAHGDKAAPTKPFWQSVAVGTTHCGSGCTLADLIVEWAVLAVPVTLFGSHVFGTWAVDFVVAFAFGIVFQYFAIVPMQHLAPAAGLVAALKADALSLTAWQLGMYGWMALARFVFFPPAALPKTAPPFWFMMQVAMGAGFVASYPVNWWLLRRGIKETM